MQFKRELVTENYLMSFEWDLANLKTYCYRVLQQLQLNVPLKEFLGV